ncbi:glutamate receptor, metabotropic 8, isoform CRA_b [Rattus norvegicus]|uniref:Glutamate receptor, metabotropic 8, isoform CRA_b n=1 Tax=Rattus norvegicus TaxID=10116 RepID=A6IEA2_RAT|nr:glutamate receptor, metabotropic 8, isoform CRA_b [Rattus norvegicus]
MAPSEGRCCMFLNIEHETAKNALWEISIDYNQSDQ